MVNDPAARPVPSRRKCVKQTRVPQWLMRRCSSVVESAENLVWDRTRKKETILRGTRRYGPARPPIDSLPVIGSDPSPNRILIPNQTATKSTTRASDNTLRSGIAGTRYALSSARRAVPVDRHAETKSASPRPSCRKWRPRRRSLEIVRRHAWPDAALRPPPPSPRKTRESGPCRNGAQPRCRRAGARPN